MSWLTSFTWQSHREHEWLQLTAAKPGLLAKTADTHAVSLEGTVWLCVHRETCTQISKKLESGVNELMVLPALDSWGVWAIKMCFWVCYCLKMANQKSWLETAVSAPHWRLLLPINWSSEPVGYNTANHEKEHWIVRRAGSTQAGLECIVLLGLTTLWRTLLHPPVPQMGDSDFIPD